MDSSYYIRSAKCSVCTDATLSPVLLQTESGQYVCSVHAMQHGQRQSEAIDRGSHAEEVEGEMSVGMGMGIGIGIGMKLSTWTARRL
jgi:hypothetical protein